MIGRMQRFLVLLLALLGSCVTLPPGADVPHPPSIALIHPEQTRLGRLFSGHGEVSGFRFISAGADGFLMRMQMIDAAESTIDLQYFIFREDDTGRLLTEALLRAADRGVRIRVLVDDGQTEDGDDKIAVLEALPSVEVRIFNPFAYRGHVPLFRTTEFALGAARLDYRMHNKLFVVDNAIALVGGRNIGDQYFQIDPDSQFADDDVFAAGPVVRQLSASFDEFWNSPLAVPAQELSGDKPSVAALKAYRQELNAHRQQVDGLDYVKRVASREPFDGIVSGRLPLTWAHVEVVYDSPDKRKVVKGTMAGKLMQPAVAAASRQVQTELLMVTPYLIPGKEGMQLLMDLRQRHVVVRILTNSLESATVLPAQAGYMHYRVPMLEHGVELHEVRSRPGNSRGSGQSKALTLFGNYSLHAKLFVFDRKRLFIGSMNFDERSMHLNTEIGLIIDSPDLARQAAARFEAMVQPANAYQLALRPGPKGQQALLWRTQESGKPVEYEREPARNDAQRLKANSLSLLPLDPEL